MSSRGKKKRRRRYLEAFLKSRDLALRLLRQKEADTANKLAGQIKIYLDTNHWINLRHVVTGHTAAKREYAGMLSVLENLVNRGRACCPVSGTLFDPPTQAEVQALRDKAEKLADDVRALSALVHALRGALVAVGVVKGGA